MLLYSSHFAWQNFALDDVLSFDLGNSQIIGGLQVKPELGTGSKVAGKPQSGIGRYAAFLADDVVNARGWHFKRDSQGVAAQVERVKIFLAQHFAGMDGRQWVAGNHIGKVELVKVLGQYGHGLALVVIHYLNIESVIAFKPEANTPLVINPDAPTSKPVTGQFFQPVAGWVAQVIRADGCIQQHQFTQCQRLKIAWPFTRFMPGEDRGGVLAFKRLNHWYDFITQSVKRQTLKTMTMLIKRGRVGKSLKHPCPFASP